MSSIAPPPGRKLVQLLPAPPLLMERLNTGTWGTAFYGLADDGTTWAWEFCRSAPRWIQLAPLPEPPKPET
jgi:hypothetical protein